MAKHQDSQHKNPKQNHLRLKTKVQTVAEYVSWIGFDLNPLNFKIKFLRLQLVQPESDGMDLAFPSGARKTIHAVLEVEQS